NKITRINYNISDLLGYSESELVGKPIDYILARSNALKIDELIKLDNLSSQCFSLELITKTSQDVSVIVYFSSLFDCTGHKKGTICLAMSVKNISLIDLKLYKK
ncbi:PAS domain-containing protein, partial [Anaplasma marginale]|uniref:PAS domain-containing protein n=1 Tax=Anaplasma marginale TaxID=770 RepID=UPI0005B36D15